MTFDIGLHEVCVPVGVRYVITKFSRMDSLPNFLTHGAPLRARFARTGAPLLKLAVPLTGKLHTGAMWQLRFNKENAVIPR